MGRNITAAGGSVNISDSAKLNGNLVAGSGSLTVLAPIAKDITLGSGDATIGNSVGGNVNAGVGNLTLTSNAKIKGDLTYLSDRDVQIQPGAQITGKTVHNRPPITEKSRVKSFPAGFKIYSFLTSLLVGFIIIKLIPVFTKKVTDDLTARPLALTGIGFLTIIAAPIFIIVMALTLVGIPLALISLFSFLITLYLSKIFVAIAIGQKLLKFIKQKPADLMTLTAGLVVYLFVGIIPLIGHIILIVFIFAGVGALVTAKLNLLKQFRSKKLI